ncbi:hypothetical protein GJU40_02130 [Bacillus lacus]|uniref:Peptidase n=1 Tax=Metabacillus lacus TaxID=1983721 RepID=A0A7X2IWD5_9BACI|nr:DUF5590 domain-containing protein [Metabacillus lacus]MRX70965.1 hypothetical protein [Metabacillus lacus]
MRNKILIVLGILLVFGAAAGIYANSIYQTAMKQKTSGHSAAAETAAANGNVAGISSVNSFYGQEHYYVISGTAEDGTEVYAWVKDESEPEVIVKEKASGISKENAQSIIQQYNPKRITGIQLGMEKNIPLWEVKYIDEHDRYTYDYIDFTTGDIIKHSAIK